MKMFFFKNIVEFLISLEKTKELTASEVEEILGDTEDKYGSISAPITTRSLPVIFWKHTNLVRQFEEELVSNPIQNNIIKNERYIRFVSCR